MSVNIVCIIATQASQPAPPFYGGGSNLPLRQLQLGGLQGGKGVQGARLLCRGCRSAVQQPDVKGAGGGARPELGVSTPGYGGRQAAVVH